MTFVLDVWTADGEDVTSRSFKTLRSALGAGGRALERIHGRRFYGYQACDRREGDYPGRRHIVAEWRDGARVLARVWT